MAEAWLLSPQCYSADRLRPLDASQWAEWVDVTEAGLRSPQKPLVGQPRRMLRTNEEKLWLNLILMGWQGSGTVQQLQWLL